LSDEEESRGRSLASLRRARQKHKHNLDQAEQVKVVREVIIPDTITVGELANRMAVRGADVIKSLMKLGMMVTINQPLDGDTAELLCGEFGHKFKRVSEADIELGLRGADDKAEDLIHRAPVVTVMGHVDHGKTSLLDALRKTDVVSGEAGGITQHIGAYQVTLKSGQKITFIDTPGHAAFTEMRARGARVTDIAVLVVAADDGIKEQTVEAIHHAKAAKVPIVVAINKMDKPEANPERVRSELLQHEVILEEFGGDVLSVEVSAKKQLNLDLLEEKILLQAEVLDLKANPNRSAEGVVIEAQIDKGRGTVATVLVQRGMLKVGDIFVAGTEWGRVRALVNDHGQKIETVTPAMPVEVLGFNGVPLAGDEFFVVETEARAREVAEFRQRRQRDTKAAASARTSMEQMMTQIAAGEVRELPIVIKSDVQGSLEAIQASLSKLATAEVNVRVLHGGVGGINESDITLARASNGIVIGFNVRTNPQARELARRDNVEIRYYSIIYDVIDDMKALMGGLLAPTLREKFLGLVEVRQVFTISKVGKVAGCYVTEGLVKRGAKVRLLRDNVVIHEGDLQSLKRFKDEVKEVKESYECGIVLENYNDIRENDVIECYEIESVARQL
jgi:translation initiation factor IF-2